MLSYSITFIWFWERGGVKVEGMAVLVLGPTELNCIQLECACLEISSNLEDFKLDQVCLEVCRTVTHQEIMYAIQKYGSSFHIQREFMVCLTPPHLESSGERKH